MLLVWFLISLTMPRKWIVWFLISITHQKKVVQFQFHFFLNFRKSNFQWTDSILFRTKQIFVSACLISRWPPESAPGSAAPRRRASRPLCQLQALCTHQNKIVQFQLPFVFCFSNFASSDFQWTEPICWLWGGGSFANPLHHSSIPVLIAVDPKKLPAHLYF